MDRSQEIIRTSWIGIIANVLLAGFKAIVQVHGFYYSEKDNMLSVDVVPDISVHDDAAFVSQLTREIQPLVPDMQVVIVVDHNYSE